MFNVRTKNKPLLSSLFSTISISVKDLLYNNLVWIPNWKAWYFKDEEGIPDGCENSDQVNILDICSVGFLLSNTSEDWEVGTMVATGVSAHLVPNGTFIIGKREHNA